MIFDCFSFYNELDLLEIRLNVLKGVVDRFVIVEAAKTHRGEDKPLYFKENESRFAEFADKIIHVVIDRFDLPDGLDEAQKSWARENIQRNGILEGLVAAKDDDVILISDLDEIPRPEILKRERAWNGVTALGQRFSNFYFNFVNFVRPEWLGTRVLPLRVLRSAAGKIPSSGNYALVDCVNNGVTPTRVRFTRPDHVIRNAGWHFSYLGGAEMALRKIRSVGVEYEQRYAYTEADVRRIIDSGEDVMGCGGRYFAIPLDASFPKYVLENVRRFSKFVLDKDEAYYIRTRGARRRARVRGWVRRVVPLFLPRFVKPLLYKVYCGLVRDPIEM